MAANLLEPLSTPFDWNLQLFGTDVRISVWFWIVPAVIGAAVASFFGPGSFFIVLGCFLVSVLIHEFGHVVAGCRFGADSYIVLNGLGGAAVGCADVAERWQRIVVFAAGPLAQLLVGIPLWLAHDELLRLLRLPADSYHPGSLCLLLLASFNIGWPLFNLVPVWPLDGWHIGRELVGQFLGHNRAPWERHANWWKAGSGSRASRSSRFGAEAAARPRWQAAMGLALLVALVVGSLLLRERYWRQREQAFAVFQRLGAVAGRDEQRFYGFNFEGTNVSDDQLVPIELFDEIEDLDLDRTRVTDAGLLHLRGLLKLQRLSLRNTSVTDAGLVHLQALTSLKYLDLEGTNVSEAGLADLRKTRPSLAINASRLIK